MAHVNLLIQQTGALTQKNYYSEFFFRAYFDR